MIAEATIREALTEPTPAGSLFEACVEAVDAAWRICASDDPPPSIDLARAVIQTIIDQTESPTTCAVLTRVLDGRS